MQKKRSLFSMGVVVTAAALVLTACTPSESPEPSATPTTPTGEIRQGGIFTIGIDADPGMLDPTFSNTRVSSMIYETMCDKLYNINDDGVAFPQLAAEAPEISADGLTITVKLRENVTFHDGTDVNAEAVKTTLERYKNAEGSQRATELDAIESIEVVDEHTVALHTIAPMPMGLFYNTISARAGVILSPTALEELGDDGFAAAPVCAGAFKYESRIAQDSLTLSKYDGYHRADEVHLDKVIYRIIPDSSIRLTNLLSGDLDAINRVSAMDIAQISADPSINVVNTAGLGFYNLNVNLGEQANKAFSEDKRVRHALQMAINRDAINTTVFSGLFAPACGFMAPTDAMATPSTLECSEFDPEGARALLEETGLDLPIQVELLVNQSPELRRVSEMIQSMASDVGIDITINIQESTATVDMVRSGDYELYFNSYTGGTDPSIERFAASDSPSNSLGYSNAQVDELLVKTESTIDLEERAGYFAEIDEILRDELPMIFMIRPSNLNAIKNYVVGAEIRATGSIAATFAGLTHDAP